MQIGVWPLCVAAILDTLPYSSHFPPRKSSSFLPQRHGKHTIFVGRANVLCVDSTGKSQASPKSSHTPFSTMIAFSITEVSGSALPSYRQGVIFYLYLEIVGTDSRELSGHNERVVQAPHIQQREELRSAPQGSHPGFASVDYCVEQVVHAPQEPVKLPPIRIDANSPSRHFSSSFLSLHHLSAGAAPKRPP